jgi:hypothetical protein
MLHERRHYVTVNEGEGDKQGTNNPMTWNGQGTIASGGPRAAGYSEDKDNLNASAHSTHDLLAHNKQPLPV